MAIRVWSYAVETVQRFRDNKLYKFMTRNFLLSKFNVMAGRVWVVCLFFPVLGLRLAYRHVFITSCFSHVSGTHLLVNMVSLYGLGLPLAMTIGAGNFMTLYLASGIVSGLAFLGNNAIGQKNQNRIYANGASGAVYGAMSFFACMQPRATFLLFFVIPAPAWALVPAVMAWDVWNVFQSGHSNIASDAHIGGALTGVAFWILRRRLLPFA